MSNKYRWDLIIYLIEEVNPKNNKNALNQVKELYIDSFPPEELIPWTDILDALECYNITKLKDTSLLYTLLGIYNKSDTSKLLGFIFIIYPIKENFAFFNYLAIAPQYRNLGIGSILWKEAKDYLQNLSLKLKLKSLIGVFYEIERLDLPQYDNQKRSEIIKRYKFYQRLNQKIVDLPYYLPPLQPEEEELPLLLIFYPFKEVEELSKKLIINVYTFIYRQVYGLKKRKFNKIKKKLEYDEWPEIINLNTLDTLI